MTSNLKTAVAVGLALLFGAHAWTAPALAETRVALVVGNSAYQHAPALPNPARDAKSMAAMFQKNGFDTVVAQYDVGNLDFKRAIRQFEDKASDADIAVVYFAGHGIEVHGINYVIPVDATLASDRDAEDEAIPLDRLVQSVDGAKRLRVIILDACRDNPFARTMKLQRTAAVRGITAGLGAAEPTTINTLIAYAAKAGSAAEDGDGDHSPFTLALLSDLFVPGLDIRLAFGRVRDDVLKKTGNRQEPFVYGSLGGTNIAIVAPPTVSQQSAVADAQGEKGDYALVEKIGTKGAWEVFLAQHPTGFYSDLARQQITKLAMASTGTPAVATDTGKPQPTLAALEQPASPSPPRGPTSEEQRAWDKIKDSSDANAFRSFVKKYPNSVLASIAQQHADAIDKAAQEQAAARLKAQQDAALAKAQQDAKAAEQARLQAERDAAAKQAAAAAASQAKADAEALAKAQRDAKAAEQARLDAERQAQAQQDAVCKSEQDQLNTLQNQGGKARDDLKMLQQSLACEKLRPMVTAALDRAITLPDVNTTDQVRAAQQELARIGCYSGTADGNLSSPTKSAVQAYESARGNKNTGDIDITDDLVSELKKQSGRVCPLVCPSGQTAQGDTCIANAPAKTPPAATQAQKPSKQQKSTASSRPSQPPSQPTARPAMVPQIAIGGSVGGGHAGTTIGVGF